MSSKRILEVTIGAVIGCFLLVTVTLYKDNDHQSKYQVRRMTSGDKSTEYNVSLADGKMFEIIGTQLFHNKNHFTQGLTYSNNVLYESVGLYGKSKVCRLDPTTGESTKCVQMNERYFAEGMQVYGEPGKEKLIQLTWKSRKGFIRDATTLEEVGSFMFNTTLNEGWGICLDKANNEFIVSDGSPFLHFWDVDTLKPKRKVEVKRQNGNPARNLNELEFVDGKVVANVWYSDVLLVIDPVSGECEKEYDFSMLFPKNERRSVNANVFNGISVSDEKGVLYVTGKFWDRMYKVKLLDKLDQPVLSNFESHENDTHSTSEENLHVENITTNITDIDEEPDTTSLGGLTTNNKTEQKDVLINVDENSALITTKIFNDTNIDSSNQSTGQTQNNNNTDLSSDLPLNEDESSDLITSKIFNDTNNDSSNQSTNETQNNNNTDLSSNLPKDIDSDTNKQDEQENSSMNEPITNNDFKNVTNVTNSTDEETLDDKQAP